VCIMLMFVVWGLAFDFKRFIFNIVFLFISNGCMNWFEMCLNLQNVGAVFVKITRYHRSFWSKKRNY
jgi:hypothetical protein